MNDRIKELLARPGLERLNDWASIGPVQRAALEEFAELVVLECIDVVDAYDRKTDPDDIIVDIKEHFGIEP